MATTATERPIVLTDRLMDNACLGLTPYLGLASDKGESMKLEAALGAEAAWERDTRILLKPKKILTYPGASDVKGVTYDIQDSQWSIHRFYSSRPLNLYTHFKPLVGTPDVRIEFDPSRPVIDMPSEWMRYEYRYGHITIYPFGAVAQISASAASVYVQLWALTGLANGTVPNILSVDYTAGLPDGEAATASEWADLRQTLVFGMKWRLLELLRDVLPSSPSADGFSQDFGSVDTRIEGLKKAEAEGVSKIALRERNLVVGFL